jgi:hypothetical protein
MSIFEELDYESDDFSLSAPSSHYFDGITTLQILGGHGFALAGVAAMAYYTSAWPELRFFTIAACLAFVAVGTAAAIALFGKLVGGRDAFKVKCIVGGMFALAVATWLISPASASTHPVFNTRVTGKSANRPAIQVNITDDSELPFGRAELYLSVQSSRFPNEVRLIFPLNRGDVQGCNARFIQLPFEVADDDVLLFNLLDDDHLTADEEQMVIKACHATGFCLAIGSAIYQPQLAPLLRPVFMKGADVLGDKIVLHYEQNPFENMGVCQYIVQSSRPDAPNKANKVSLVDQNQYTRADVQVYFPTAGLPEFVPPVTNSTVTN